MNTFSLSDNDTPTLTRTTTLLQRLKELTGIRTDVELSDVLGIKPNTLSTWKKRNTLDYKKVLETCHSYRLDLNKIFLCPKVFSRCRQHRKKEFPVVPREIYYPYVTHLKDPQFIDSLPRFNFPFISGKNIRAFQIMGSGMSPKLEDGNFVVGEHLEDTGHIIDGQIYILVSKLKGVFINRIKRDTQYPGFLHLINDKKVISPQIRMDEKEIVELWKVTSVFSLDFVEGHPQEPNG